MGQSQVTEIEPNPDAYGTRARASALADFVELWALSDHHPSRAELADYIADNQWAPKMHELYSGIPEAYDRAADESDEDDLSGDEGLAAARVFDVLEERREILGDLYPFRVEDDRCYFVGGGEPYLVVLAIAVAHAYSIAVPANPRDTFEDTVARGVRRLVGRAVNFRRERASGGGFDEALIRAGTDVGLQPIPSAASRAKFAVDERVDTIAHLDWLDGRIGRWTFIGQVTCAKSDRWLAKLIESPVPTWTKLLGDFVRSQAFLAIPYHAEPSNLYNLVEETERVVVDRLRLVRWLDDVSEDERAILSAVRSMRVAPAS